MSRSPQKAGFQRCTGGSRRCSPAAACAASVSPSRLRVVGGVVAVSPPAGSPCAIISHHCTSGSMLPGLTLARLDPASRDPASLDPASPDPLAPIEHIDIVPRQPNLGGGGRIGNGRIGGLKA